MKIEYSPKKKKGDRLWRRLSAKEQTRKIQDIHAQSPTQSN